MVRWLLHRLLLLLLRLRLRLLLVLLLPLQHPLLLPHQHPVLQHPRTRSSHQGDLRG